MSLIRRLPAPRAVVTAALVVAGSLAVLVGCDRRPRQAAANDTAGEGSPAVDGSAPAAPAPVSTHGWRLAEAGPALVVAAGSALRAQLVFPQYTDSTLTATTSFATAPLAGDTVELFAPGGLVGRATLAEPAVSGPGGGSGTGADGCIGWPRARVVPAEEPLSPWKVAFLAGHARALPLDSTVELAGPDSAHLAADVARLSSALPQDAASPFRGLPFVVRDMRRFALDSVQVLVADVVRRVNQEASQQMEHTLLVAERPAGRPDAPWTTAYHERTTGPEETLEMSEVLAAVRLGDAGRPTLVVGRDYGDGGMVYSLVERVGPARWRLRWSSAYSGC
ncbi:MAG TPA: hypothetical protein VFS08_18740 [Gemmatimonadaceae bacterium]|nr:hypothetical protein [Gemmatimonadaceae bacterium]